jgi:hypothetical protein
MADITALSQLLDASLDPRRHKEGKLLFCLPIPPAVQRM